MCTQSRDYDTDQINLINKQTIKQYNLVRLNLNFARSKQFIATLSQNHF
jgi:hypothetical protein